PFPTRRSSDLKIHPSYLRTSELHISIFIRQTTIAFGLTPSTRLKVKQSTRFIKTEVECSAGITTWWISDVRGKDGSFARSEEAQFDPSYHLWSKYAFLQMQTKWHLIF